MDVKASWGRGGGENLSAGGDEKRTRHKNCIIDSRGFVTRLQDRVKFDRYPSECSRV